MADNRPTAGAGKWTPTPRFYAGAGGMGLGAAIATQVKDYLLLFHADKYTLEQADWVGTTVLLVLTILGGLVGMFVGPRDPQQPLPPPPPPKGETDANEQTVGVDSSNVAR